MGKGQRARAARAGKKEEIRRIAQKQKMRRKIAGIVGICIAAVIVIGILGGVAYSTVASTGYFLRNTVVMSTDNYEVDNAMMTYFLKNQYYSFIDQFSSNLSMFGLSTDKSLKSQKYGSGTWFDYFLSQTQSYVEEILALAEKAKAEGYTLNDDDMATVDKAIVSMETYAEKNSLTLKQYLVKAFGEGINESDVRRAVELSTLASKYYKDFAASLEYTDEDLQGYFNENKSKFIKADYISYDFNAGINDEMTDEEKDAAKAEAKAKAEKLTACTSEEEFKSVLKSILIDDYIASATEETDEEKQIKAEEKAATELENISNTDYYAEETTDDEGNTVEVEAYLKWMFEDGRKVNDTYFAEPSTDDDSTVYMYTAYLITKTQYYDDYITANVGHILLTEDQYETLDAAKAKADELLEELNADKTKEKLAELASEYSADTIEGGMYEGLTKDTSLYSQEFIDWAYDESRKEGDTAVIQTNSGYHVMYYLGTGDVAWKINAENLLSSNDQEAHITELTKAYPVTSNKAKIKKIKA